MGLSTANLVASPACLPGMELADILPAYAAMGFGRFEAFSGWCASHLDFHGDASAYVRLARRHGMTFRSFHLPPITSDLAATLPQAVQAARFAQEIGADVVLYKADSRETYVRAAREFLDALDAGGIAVTPVVQNHKGTPVTTLADFYDVLTGIDDRRMHALLEVGHFQRAGAHWRQGYDLLDGRIALVHINEIDPAGNSVPFGTGVVDFASLIARLNADGYEGDVVLELELEDRQQNPKRTLDELARAIDHLVSCGLERA